MRYSFYQFYRRNILALCLLMGGVLALGGAAFLLLTVREDEYRALHMQARMIAYQMEHLPQAYSKREAQKRLAAVLVNPTLQLACIWDAQGKLVAQKVAPLNTKSCSKTPRDPASGGVGRWLWVEAKVPFLLPPIAQPAGEIYLLGRLPSLKAKLLLGSALLGGMLLSILLFSLVLAKSLRFTLLRPLRHIASTAQRVTLYKDYSLRVGKAGGVDLPQEVELLMESFNGMLKEIEDRDGRLTRKTVELERARVAAEEASRAKSNFLANVSHELRTPLNAIIGFSSMLEAEQFGPMGNEKYQQYAKDIHDSGRHLLEVINDILDLSKAESGKLSVKLEPFALAKIIEKSLQMIAHQAMENQVTIHLDVPNRMPRMVADRVRILQILLNILSNAIKFSHKGGEVLFRVRCEAARNEGHVFTISIEDRGIGMSDLELAHVFEAFHQVDGGLNRKYQGTGLGLPLTKRLVELHHGKIKIESVKDQGTIVTLRFISDAGLLD